MNSLGSPNAHAPNSAVRARVGYLLLAGLFMVIGVVLAGDLPIDDILGVRTSRTLKGPFIWAAVNDSAGLLLAFWGWLGLAVLSQFSIRTSRTLAFTVAAGGLLALPVLAPAAFVDAHAVLTSHGFKARAGSEPSLVALLIAVAAFAGVGNVLHREHIKRNRYFGFRLKTFMENDAAWEKGNRAGGLVLQLCAAVGLLMALLLLAAGHGSAAFGAAMVTLLISPLLATASAKFAVKSI
jgi:uncharacterized membrane protein